MEALSARDLRLVLDGVYDLMGVDDLAALPEAILALTERVVSSEITSYNEVDIVEKTVISISTPASAVFDNAADVLAQHMAENPLVMYQGSTRDGTPRRISDFISTRELRRRGIYRLLYRPLGVERQMAFGLPEPGKVIGIAVNRSGPDFGERDRAALALLRPFIVRHRRNLVARALDRAAASGDAGHSLDLTQRQSQIVSLVSQGATNAQIATALAISEHTVAKHLENVFRRLGVTNRTAAVHRWLEASGQHSAFAVEQPRHPA